MDKVRLGRALGYGTRHAAKTIAAVAEAAAAAPDGRPTSPAQPEVMTPRRAATRGSAARMAERMPGRMPSAAQVRGAGRSFWGPLATFSGALWLRVTGVFFAVIALAMANGAWRLRGVLQRGGGDPSSLRHLWVFVTFAVLFGYFAVSSFVRANLRERRAGRRRAA